MRLLHWFGWPVVILAIAAAIAIRVRREPPGLREIRLSDADVSRRGDEYEFRIRPKLRTGRVGVFRSTFNWRALASVSYGERGKLRPLEARMTNGPSGENLLMVKPPWLADKWALQLRAIYAEEVGVAGYRYVIRSNEYVWRGPLISMLVTNGISRR